MSESTVNPHNPVNFYYQPYYTDFHKCDLFDRRKPITPEAVADANRILASMYAGESDEMRNYRLLTQRDGSYYHKTHDTVCEFFMRTNKFHRVFFLAQTRLFAQVMGINERIVRVNIDAMNGQFSLTYVQNGQSEYRNSFRGDRNGGERGGRRERNENRAKIEDIGDLVHTITREMEKEEPNGTYESWASKVSEH